MSTKRGPEKRAMRFEGGGPLDGDTRDVDRLANGFEVPAWTNSGARHFYKRTAADRMEYRGCFRGRIVFAAPSKPWDE